MKTNYLKLIMILLIFSFVSCDTYKDLEPEVSPAYPIAGDWYVRDYEPGDIDYNNSRSKDYNLYIYGSSLKPETELWINNNKGTRIGYVGKYKVKGMFNKDALTFNNVKLPFYSDANTASLPDSILGYTTISESKILKKEWPEADSIIFRVVIFSGQDVELPIDTFYTAGHRTKGTEDPYFDEQ